MQSPQSESTPRRLTSLLPLLITQMLNTTNKNHKIIKLNEASWDFFYNPPRKKVRHILKFFFQQPCSTRTQESMVKVSYSTCALLISEGIKKTFRMETLLIISNFFTHTMKTSQKSSKWRLDIKYDLHQI